MARSSPRRTAREPTPGPRRTLPALLVTLAVAASLALAGCTADRDDDDVDRNAELSYEGEEGGSHRDTADCNDDGLLTSTGALETGNLTITVTDGNDRAIFEESLNGTLTGESEGLTGEPGKWSIEVTRSDDFDGTYIVNLGC